MCACVHARARACMSENMHAVDPPPHHRGPRLRVQIRGRGGGAPGHGRPRPLHSGGLRRALQLFSRMNGHSNPEYGRIVVMSFIWRGAGPGRRRKDSFAGGGGARTRQDCLLVSRDGLPGRRVAGQQTDVPDDARLLLAHPTAQRPLSPGPGRAGLVGQQPAVVEAVEDDLHGRGAVAGLLGQGPGETLLGSEVMWRASPCAGYGRPHVLGASTAASRGLADILSSTVQRRRHTRPRLARSRRAVGWCGNTVWQHGVAPS
jgi:hypothetical protein